MKRIYLNLTIAKRSLYNFKLRSALALLGVFLGTFSLIVVSNLSGSFAQKTMLEINSLGENLLIVRSGIVKHFGARTRLISEATNLTIQDAAIIMAHSSFIKQLSPSSSKTFPVRYKDKVFDNILIAGVFPNYPDTRNFHAQKGRFVSESDNLNLNKMIVIGKSVAEKIFGSENPIGKYILIHRTPCLVIGIMEAKGADISGVDQDNQIFIPLNTFLKRFVNKDYIDTIYIQATDERSISSAKAEITAILRNRHNISRAKDDDFTLIDLKDVAALKAQAIDLITILGRISAVISFLIGGIGILSIMILIVNERKVEIGIRRAVGSKKRDIIFQFLLESSFISLGGGILGVLSGFIVSIIIFKISGLPFNVSFSGLIFSFIASVGIGILAGIYPSQKAVAIQPIDIIKL